MLEITLEVSEEQEATASPYWLIIDPRQMMSPSVHTVGSMITGPFFNREAAEEYLERTRYNFSNKAKVYCHSGVYTEQYHIAYKEAQMKKKKEEKTRLLRLLEWLRGKWNTIID